MNGLRELGYLWLVRRYSLKVCGLLCQSYATEQSVKRVVREGIVETTHYPVRRYRLEDTWQGQLTFALKREGVNLEVLRAFFRVVDESEMTAFVAVHPLGTVQKRVWFLYEFLTGRTLAIPDGKGGGYVPLVDGKLQYALPVKDGTPSRRHHVVNNLIGNRVFSPYIRKTPGSGKKPCGELKAAAEKLLANYPADLVYRAVRYLYVKETKSSFSLENETPDRRRTEAFVDLLRRMDGLPLDKNTLLGVQNSVVDPRYAQRDWRTDQVYVGETITPGNEKVHFVAPRPDAIGELMQGWLDCLDRWLDSGEEDSVAMAAAIGFAFVFLHPFDDGNGRVHRYLLHAILARRGFVPRGLIFPVSAVMLKNRLAYDKALESFSSRLMGRVDYSMDDNGELSVLFDTRDLYRAIDYTPVVEYFREVVAGTIRTEWKAELDWLDAYDRMRGAMRQIVDMPDKKADQFIRFALQNGGRISARKRGMFPELSDGEVARLEAAVNAACKQTDLENVP